jgi:hypothetical protein
MGYVAGAYLVILALFAGYAVTLVGRQRTISDLADAAGLRGESR